MSDRDQEEFVPMPREAWVEIEGGCKCPFCSPDRKVAAVAFWDTVHAESRDRVHMPEIHGRVMQRQFP